SRSHGAVQLARQAGARVIATCRSEKQRDIIQRAGAHEVVLVNESLVERLKQLAPRGIDHIVEVAFDANIQTDLEVLAQGGSIATYASHAFTPEIPFWQLVFGNARLFFIGSDDVPVEAKVEATHAIDQLVAAGGLTLHVAEIVSLDEIAQAHEMVESPKQPWRVIVTL
ncbi:MAG: NADPH:quinone reductase, partial [Cytophagaceae bacterium]